MPASRAALSGSRRKGNRVKDSRRGNNILAALALLWACLALVLSAAVAQPTVVQTGTGTNRCDFVLNFPNGEKVLFQHRWNGTSLNAKTLLEELIQATGGELVVTDGYLTPFSPALLLTTNPANTGLVVHYQGSYAAPYLNGIRWNGPAGPVGADYFYPDDWWHLWVQGPAHVDQSYGWPDPLPPLDLTPASGWFFGEYSGLADLTLLDGSSIGLVYGSANQPSFPAPTVKSVLLSSGHNLEIRFSSVPGIRYQLETCADLAVDNWIPCGDPIVASATHTTMSVPINSSTGRGFYRVGLLP